MPRQPRIYSSTDIYHVMVRGINKERIFVKEKYKFKVLDIIKEIRSEVIFHIIAYCIMDNHLHLLINAEESELTTFMKKLNIKYAMYYNYVEERCGHVFQDRFKSETVEDEKYLLGVLRYVHNNPVKARTVNNIIDYKWSSAKDYIRRESEIISNKYLTEILNSFINVSEFTKFHNLDDINIYIDIKEDEQENIQSIISNIMEKFIYNYQFTDQKQLKKEHKEELAEKLIRLNLCTIKEVAGLCNLSINTVCELNKKLKG